MKHDLQYWPVQIFLHTLNPGTCWYRTLFLKAQWGTLRDTDNWDLAPPQVLIFWIGPWGQSTFACKSEIADRQDWYIHYFAFHYRHLLSIQELTPTLWSMGSTPSMPMVIKTLVEARCPCHPRLSSDWWPEIRSECLLVTGGLEQWGATLTRWNHTSESPFFI